MKVKQKPKIQTTNLIKKEKEKEKMISARSNYNNDINNFNFNKNGNGLGNSLFRGQKFIDFQEPFNDSMKPIRNYIKETKISDETYNPNSENTELIQVEIEDEINISNDNIEQTDEKLKKEKIPISIDKKEKISNHNQNNNKEKVNGLENIYDIIYKNPKPRDNLITNSKYFNNLAQRSNMNLQNMAPSIMGENDDTVTVDKIISYRPTLIEDDYINIINPHKDDTKESNLNLGKFSDRKVNYIQEMPFGFVEKKTSRDTRTDQGLKDYQFQSNQFSTKTNSKNTCNYNILKNSTNIFSDDFNLIDYKKAYSKSIVDKIENSMITKDNNLNNFNKGDDESKSYIREILEMYSSSDIHNKLDKLGDISNFEIRNLDNINLSQHEQLSSQDLNLNQIEKKSNSNSAISNNPNKSFIAITCKDGYNINNKFMNVINSPNNIKDDPVELPSRRRNIANNHITAASGYLNRRHVETLRKLERIKKEREIREKSEAKFKPEINKKSREIVEKMNYKMVNKNTDFAIVKSGKKMLSKSIDYITTPIDNMNKKKLIHNSENKSDLFDHNLIINRRNQRLEKSEGKRRKNASVESIRYDNVNEEESLVEEKPEINKERFFYKNDELIRNGNFNENNQIKRESDKEIKCMNTSSNTKNYQYQYKLPNTINLEINNKIYVPHNANKAQPKLETPVFKNNNFSPNYDIVNYGTKPNKSITEIKEPPTWMHFSNYNYPKEIINQDRLTNSNLPRTNVKQQTNPPNSRRDHVSDNFEIPEFASNANIINSESKNRSLIQEKDSVSKSPICLADINKPNQVDHVEIDLFSSDIHSIPNTDSIKQSSVLNNTKTSMIQLFPVFERPVFNMENNITSKENFNNRRSKAILFNNISNNNEFKNNPNYNYDSNPDFNIKYPQSNIDINNDNTKIIDSEEESIVNEYNMERNRKQNQSNLNLYENKSRINYDGIINKENNSNNLVDNTNSNTNLLQDTLNFSKFTNFVGMSEQYSKKLFAQNKILNKEYSTNSNLLNKQNLANGHQVDLSDRNIINSYMSQDQMNKNPSSKIFERENTRILDQNDKIRDKIQISLLEGKKEVKLHDNKQDVVVAEIDLFNDQVSDLVQSSNLKNKINKTNYFDYDVDFKNNIKRNNDVVAISSTNNYNPIIQKSGSFNLNHELSAIKENRMENIEENKINIDELIKPKYLFKNMFEKPKSNPFVNNSNIANSNKLAKSHNMEVMNNPNKSNKHHETIHNSNQNDSNLITNAKNKNEDFIRNVNELTELKSNINNNIITNSLTNPIGNDNNLAGSNYRIAKDISKFSENSSKIGVNSKTNSNIKISSITYTKRNPNERFGKSKGKIPNVPKSKSKPKVGKSTNNLSNIIITNNNPKSNTELKVEAILSPNKQTKSTCEEENDILAKYSQNKNFSNSQIESEIILSNSDNMANISDSNIPFGKNKEKYSLVDLENLNLISSGEEQLNLDTETKPKSTSNNYDLTKFSIDIPNAINLSKIKQDAPYHVVNEFVSNTLRMHSKIFYFILTEISQENCQKQINDLLNKIRMSQEEHEANLKNDLKNLNFNESSLSNLFKDEQTSFKCDNEADITNFVKKI